MKKKQIPCIIVYWEGRKLFYWRSNYGCNVRARTMVPVYDVCESIGRGNLINAWELSTAVHCTFNYFSMLPAIKANSLRNS